MGPAEIEKHVERFIQERRDFVRNLYAWLQAEKAVPPSIALDVFVAKHYIGATTKSNILADHVFDGGGEGQFDAFVIHHSAQTVTAIQGKAREQRDKELHSEIYEFIEGLAVLSPEASKTEVDAFLAKIQIPALRARIKEARGLLGSGYRLNAVYATLADVTRQGLKNGLTGAVKRAGLPADTRTIVLDGRQLDSILGFALDLLDEGVPFLAFDTVQAPVVETFNDGYSLLITTLEASQLVSAYKEYADRLFSANVRNYQGRKKGPVDAMWRQIQVHPEMFHLLNNGVTIVCSGIDGPVLRPDGRHEIGLFNPQIVNGQQTTRTLVGASENPEFAAYRDNLNRTKVIVKILPENEALLTAMDMRPLQFAHLVAVASNNQIAVSAADLRSNERVLVDLESSMRDLNVYLARKSGAAPEIRLRARAMASLLGTVDPDVVRTTALASAVAATDPGLRLFSGRYGPTRLFEDAPFEGGSAIFDRVFREDRSHFECYAMFAIHELARKAIGLGQEYGDMRSVAATVVWEALSLSGAAQIEKAARLLRASRTGAPLDPKETSALNAIDALTDKVTEACVAFYGDKKGKGEDLVDFYKGFDDWDGFDEYLQTSNLGDEIDGFGRQARRQMVKAS